MSKTTKPDAMKINADLVWEVRDRFTRARAWRIRTPEGEPTPFAMVYGWAAKGGDGGSNLDGHWEPIRPVSDRYRPIKTEEIVDLARERLGDANVTAETVRTDRFGTSLEVNLRLDKPIEVPARPFDRDHPWTAFGEKGGGDIMYPQVVIRNAYDATSSVVVEVGWFRLICSNGMKVQIAGLGTRAIHTVHEVARVIDAVARQDFAGDRGVIAAMTRKALPKADAKFVYDRLPEKWAKDLRGYVEAGGGTVWAMANGLSYLQTHVYSLTRSRQLDPLVRRVTAAAA